MRGHVTCMMSLAAVWVSSEMGNCGNQMSRGSGMAVKR